MNLSNKAKLDCYIARLPTDQFVSVHCGSVDNLEKCYLLPPPHSKWYFPNTHHISQGCGVKTHV